MPATTIDEWDDQPLWAFEPGETILDDVRAVERLGVGDRCESWLAQSTRLGPVVLKICRPHQVDHPRGTRAMHREADALARVLDPAVRALVENRLDGPFPALVLEHAPGTSLSELVDDETLSIPQTMAMMAALTGAVGVSHRAGIVHLDLKPTNVILERDRAGHPLLIDFGSSRAIGFDPGPGTPLGSPGYAPPELEQNAPITSAMDVFGLGTILFEAVTGEEPFDPDLDAADRPAPPRVSEVVPWCPPALDALVAAMLATDPLDRPSVPQLAAALAQIADLAAAAGI